MCLDPATIAVATFAVKATSSLLGWKGERQQASAERRAANRSFGLESEQLQQRQTQVNAAASENALSNLIEQQRQQGRISASASAMGSSLATATQQSNAASFELGREGEIDALNASNQRLQLSYDLAASLQSRNNRIRGAQKPGILNLGTRLAGDALGSYGTYIKAGGQK